MSDQKFPLFKFIIIGESGVGKSCLLFRYTKNDFRSEYDVTIGVEFSSKTVEIDENTKLKLQIWDTAGQESFRSIVRSFYRNVAAVFLVYNITKRESLQRLDEWIKEARENSGDNVVMVLVGAQNDREQERQISYEEGKEFMLQNELNLFFETSSKSNLNVDMAFQETAKLVFLNFISNQLQSKEQQKKTNSFVESQIILDENDDKKKKKNNDCC